MREMARALTGFRNDYTETSGRTTSGTSRPATTTASRRCSGHDPTQLGLAGRRPRGRRPPAPSLVRGSKALVVLHPDRADARDPAPSSTALYRSSGEALGPLVEAILLQPDLHAGPAMVKSPVVFTGRAAARARPGHLDRRLDQPARRTRARSSGRRTSPGGTTRGSTRRPTAPAGASSARRCGRSSTPGADYRGKTEASADALELALAVWDAPPVDRPSRRAARLAAQRDPARAWRSDLPGARQNALRQLVGAPPDFQVS